MRVLDAALIAMLLAVGCGGKVAGSGGADAGSDADCRSIGVTRTPDAGRCTENLRCASETVKVQYMIDCSCATNTCACMRTDDVTGAFAVYKTISADPCGCAYKELFPPNIVAACGLER